MQEPSRLWVHLSFWLAHVALVSGLGLLFHANSDARVNMAVLIVFASFVLLVAFCVAIGYYAAKLGRSAVAWGGLAFITMPIGVWAAYVASFFIRPLRPES